MSTANASLKIEAIRLRQQGCSYPEIEEQLKVSRSTLSGWLRDIKLSKTAQARIQDRKSRSLFEAREKAARVLRSKNNEERKFISAAVEDSLKRLDWNPSLKEAILGMLYLGEGFKKQSFVGLGNSNPNILKAFVILLRSVYTIKENRFRCILYLRSDQDEQEEREFWSEVLAIPKDQFGKSQFDSRTRGKKTWAGYHGVCAVYYYDAKIEKRLTAVQNLLLKYIS